MEEAVGGYESVMTLEGGADVETGSDIGDGAQTAEREVASWEPESGGTSMGLKRTAAEDVGREVAAGSTWTKEVEAYNCSQVVHTQEAVTLKEMAAEDR